MNAFDPSQVKCVDWRKIYNAYSLSNEDATRCAVCAEPAKAKCAGCFRVAYCSAKHQKSDWKAHKLKCCPFRLEKDAEKPELGRFVVAARDIKAGEVIIEEQPVTVGPKQFTVPVCLGCYRDLFEEDSVWCSKCGWPLCSSDCQEAPIHKVEKVID